MKKILVHLHIYYPNLYNELKNYINNITDDFDLYVSMVERHEDIINDLQNNFKNVNIDIVENRGYDVGPFIEVLNKVNLDDYSYIIKLHTKRDIKDKGIYLTNGFIVYGDRWRNDLLSFMKHYKKAINLLENNKKVGMVAGTNVILTQKQDEKQKKLIQDIKNIYKKIDIIPKNDKYLFVAGTMFIVRAELFKKLQNKFKLEDFDTPQKEPTLAHKLERAFGIIVCYNNYKITNYNNNYKLYYFKNKIIYKIKRIFFQKKITTNNKLIIKVFKIPVFIKNYRNTL